MNIEQIPDSSHRHNEQIKYTEVNDNGSIPNDLQIKILYALR